MPSKQSFHSDGITASFDKEEDPQTIVFEPGDTFNEGTGETGVSEKALKIPVVFLAYVLQQYGDFTARIDTSDWRGLRGSSDV